MVGGVACVRTVRAPRKRLQVFRERWLSKDCVRDVGSVFTKGVIVGNQFGYRIDQEFVDPSAGFAIERGAPLAKDFLKFLLFVSGELFDSLNAERTKGALRGFTDAGILRMGSGARNAPPFLAQPKPGRVVWPDRTQLSRLDGW